jgi:hypothetical protein
MSARVTANGSLAASLVAFLAASCSFADAKVGARQDACDIAAAGQMQTTPHTGSYYRVGTASTAAAPVCEGNTGDACNDCESAHCCARRSACYADPVCACADLALDRCLDDANAAPAVELAARTSQCWNTFSATGTVEQSRVACRRAWCQMECELP